MNLDAVYKEIQEVRIMVDLIESKQKQDLQLLLEHDKILVRGNGVPSLQETVRVLAKTMTDFITEVREEKSAQKSEQGRWKWLIIGIGVPVLFSFIGQVMVFWFRVVPILTEIK